MPVPKSEFEQLYPCDFYTPEELLEPERMYNVYEIARLLQGLDPDAEIDQETEQVLLDWAIPWVLFNSEDLVVAEPPTEEEPGYYGLAREEDRPDGARDGDGAGSVPGDTDEDPAGGDDAGGDRSGEDDPDE